jgi:hypothetical protein
MVHFPICNGGNEKMNYTKADYDQLYGRRSGDLSLEKMHFWRRAALLLWVIALLSVGGLLTGYDDGQAAAVTASLEREARERKELRPDQLSNPLGPCDFTLREMVGQVVLRDECYRRRAK